MYTGRNDVRAAEPLRIDGGQCVTADSVHTGINLRTCEIGEPALLIRVTVLPLLHLIKLLPPVDVGIAQQIVHVPGPAPGFVSISNLVGEDDEARDDVSHNEARTE